MALSDPLVVSTVSYGRRDFGKYRNQTHGEFEIQNGRWSDTGQADMLVRRSKNGTVNLAGVTPKHQCYIVFRTNDRAALTEAEFTAMVQDLLSMVTGNATKLFNGES
jgi:hypothetical protein